MYKVSIFNNGVETVIHSPTADKNAPHLLSLPFDEILSQPGQLSFNIPYGNPGYGLIKGLITKVKVYNTKDNTVVFTGRAMPNKDGMGQDGKFIGQITCEGALAYLNDSQTRKWHFENQTPTQILTYLLNQHNLKVDNERKINLGTVEINQPLTIDTNYETTLNTIVTKLHNILGGDIRVREAEGLLYFDYLLAQGANNDVIIKLSYNLKEIIRAYDPSDVVTRIIPLGYGEGINQLDINKVNSGVEYIEDSDAISKYGVIEGLATNKDIQNADTLKLYGQTVLNEKKQIKLSYTQTALDLSVLSGHENEKYDLGDTLRTLVDVMNIDVYSRVIRRQRDLILNPWDPQLEISTRPITLTDIIIDLKQRNQSLENAPQGSTCIFPLSKAENADADHPITFDLDIPKETLNINRVYINLHGRKYRANSKGTASGGGTTATSASGGGTSTTSASGGAFTTYTNNEWDGNSTGCAISQTVEGVETHVHYFSFNHAHSIAAHIHNIVIAAHVHAVTLADHIHSAIYGIFESTYPKNLTVKVNGTLIPNVSLGDGNTAFDQYNIDITPYVAIGNNKIEISTAQNGRIDAVVYSQIFIQAK